MLLIPMQSMPLYQESLPIILQRQYLSMKGADLMIYNYKTVEGAHQKKEQVSALALWTVYQ